MGQIAQTVHTKVKGTTGGLLTILLKLFSGGVIGLTIALIGHEMIGYSQLSFVLVIVVFTMAFLRVTKGWNFLGVFILDLILVLVGLLLRMYILVAPGA